ncbi:hypothetical protein TrVE_jg9879 [Triparma verrucosa]|uniref:Uncharacterized protein n=1 Tax=Triparma verrucosa TaxID=1606542 RepID=A0A9W6Z667_9STRA|nr:hypothetical protein TrVE_jg9879 [Triparma verrucosa]
MPRRKSSSKQTKAADGTRRRMKSRNDRRIIAVIESVLSEPESDEDDSSDSDDSYDSADSKSTPRTSNFKFAWFSCFSPLVHYMSLGASSSTSAASTASAMSTTSSASFVSRSGSFYEKVIDKVSGSLDKGISILNSSFSFNDPEDMHTCPREGTKKHAQLKSVIRKSKDLLKPSAKKVLSAQLEEKEKLEELETLQLSSGLLERKLDTAAREARESIMKLQVAFDGYETRKQAALDNKAREEERITHKRLEVTELKVNEAKLKAEMEIELARKRMLALKLLEKEKTEDSRAARALTLTAMKKKTKRSSTPTKESSSKSKNSKDKFTREITKTAKKRTEKERREDVVKAWEAGEQKEEKEQEKKVKLKAREAFSIGSF